MREIKFRAWDNKKKKWLLGYNYKELGGFSLTGELVLLGEWSAVIDRFLFCRDGYKFDDLKIMQFTGLKDKNGKEIYEGDLVISPGAKQAMWVEYQAPSFVMRCKTEGGSKSKSWCEFALAPTENQVQEIIGNIYENKELLEP